MHALLDMGNGAQFSREPDLADRDGALRKHAVVERAGDRERNGKIHSGFGDPQAADGLHEHILVGKAQSSVLLEHCNEHRKP